MKVKKIHCLNCDTIIENDWEKKENRGSVSCGCENQTSLVNYFTISQPGSIVHAIDKTKVKAQLLYDADGIGKKGDWFYLIQPEDENTPKFTHWKGQTEQGGFTGGLVVDFTTEKPMTFNECRTYLKKNYVYHEEGRIYHLMKGLN